ncbi:MAG: hypothetical protein KDD63_24465 [Bacteroidetes bacterium]|nr:hypothetical protein [Bacteroidota bacterium]MCB0855409.1 hypothetical protein [Bacteroidota bacterium]
MIKNSSRFRDYLTMLNQDENEQFKSWLKMELEGRDNPIYQWLTYILEGLGPNQAWEKMEPHSPFETKEVARWESRLLGKLELFLSIKAFREDENTQKLYLNRFIIRRGAALCYPHAIRKARRNLEKQSIKDHRYFRIQHELDRLDKEFWSRFPDIKIRGYSPKQHEIQQNYQLYILLNQIEVLLSWHKGPLSNYQESLIDELNKLLTVIPTKTEDKPTPEFEVGNFYRALFKCYFLKSVLAPEEANHLVVLYQKAFDHLRDDARDAGFLYVYNCLATSLNRTSNQKFFLEKITELNTWFTPRREFFINRYFYTNQVTLYVKLAKQPDNSPETEEGFLKQAQTFSEKYQYHLPEDERIDLFAYNQAQIYFAKDAHQKLIKLWSNYQRGKIDLKESHYDNNLEILYLKSLYATGTTFAQKSELKLLLKDLHRRISKSKKIPHENKEYYLNEINQLLGFVKKKLKKYRKN